MKTHLISFVQSLLILSLLSSCQFFADEKSESNEKLKTDGANGLKKRYRKDKTLHSAIETKDNKRHGVARSYFEDGKTVFNEIRYDKGVKNGITNSYYKSGQLFYSVNYIDGKRQGFMSKYYRSGELMAKIPYKNSEIQEGLIEYQKSGKQKVIYPHIVFEEINKAATENVYIVQIKLSNAKKNVRFYRILVDGNGDEVIEKMVMDDGIAQVRFDVRGRHTLDVKIKIKAEITTFLGNTNIIYDEKHLKIGTK